MSNPIEYSTGALASQPLQTEGLSSADLVRRVLTLSTAATSLADPIKPPPPSPAPDVSPPPAPVIGSEDLTSTASAPQIILSADFIPIYGEDGRPNSTHDALYIKEVAKSITTNLTSKKLSASTTAQKYVNSNVGFILSASQVDKSFISTALKDSLEVSRALSIRNYSISDTNGVTSNPFVDYLKHKGFDKKASDGSSVIESFLSTKLWQQSLIEMKKDLIFSSHFLSNGSKSAVRSIAGSRDAGSLTAPDNLLDADGTDTIESYRYRLGTLPSSQTQITAINGKLLKSQGQPQSQASAASQTLLQFSLSSIGDLYEQSNDSSIDAHIINPIKEAYKSVYADYKGNSLQLVLNSDKENHRNIACAINAVVREINYSKMVESVNDLSDYGFSVSLGGDNSTSLWEKLIGSPSSQIVTSFSSRDTSQQTTLFNTSKRTAPIGGTNYNILTFENTTALTDPQAPTSYINAGSSFYVDANFRPNDSTNATGFNTSRVDGLNSSLDAAIKSLGIIRQTFPPQTAIPRDDGLIYGNTDYYALSSVVEYIYDALQPVSNLYSSIIRQDDVDKKKLVLDRSLLEADSPADTNDPSSPKSPASDLNPDISGNQSGIRSACMLAKLAIGEATEYSAKSQYDYLKSTLFAWTLGAALGVSDDALEVVSKKLTSSLEKLQHLYFISHISKTVSVPNLDGTTSPIFVTTTNGGIFVPDSNGNRPTSNLGVENSDMHHDSDVLIDDYSSRRLLSRIGFVGFNQKFLSKRSGVGNAWATVMNKLASSLLSTYRNSTSYTGTDFLVVLMAFFDVLLACTSTLCPEVLKSVISTNDSVNSYFLIEEKTSTSLLTGYSIVNEKITPTIKDSISSILSGESEYMQQSLDMYSNYLNYLRGLTTKIKRDLTSGEASDYISTIKSAYDNLGLNDSDKLNRIAKSFTKYQLKMQLECLEELSDRYGIDNDSITRLSTKPSFANITSDRYKFLAASDIEHVSFSSLESFFNTSEFRPNSGHDKKILTIGIPPGLIDNVMNYTDSRSLDYIEERKTRQLIKILVYYSDLRLPGLLFKPREYVFQLNRFPTRVLSNWSNQSMRSDVTSLLQSIPSRIMQEDGTSKIYQVYDANDDSFPAGTNIGRDVYLNHSRSFLLEQYVRWFTDARIDDSRFWHFGNLYPGSPYLDQSNKNSGITQRDSSLDTFFSSYETAMLDGIEFQRRALFAKKYDRVFNVIVDPEDFQVDLAASFPSSNANERASKIADVIDSKFIIIDSTGLYYKTPASPNSISLNEYFVAVKPYTPS